eukprot:snap_masked-scaffold_42-processed-gene-1.37-mRNA-1 protein AED:1.00 eAED:1.00 QI:0/0/0/0/1/1/3/0/71
MYMIHSSITRHPIAKTSAVKSWNCKIYIHITPLKAFNETNLRHSLYFFCIAILANAFNNDTYVNDVDTQGM